jgi:hypothetical protein
MFLEDSGGGHEVFHRWRITHKSRSMGNKPISPFLVFFDIFPESSIFLPRRSQLTGTSFIYSDKWNPQRKLRWIMNLALHMCGLYVHVKTF